MSELNKELTEAKNRENRDLNVSLDTKSVEAFTTAITKAVEAVGSISISIPDDFSLEGLSVENLDKIINFCEISEILEKHPFDLSGGQIQRAALAMILLTNTDILLLDEPTKGMDAKFKEKLCKGLKELAKKQMTVIIC